MSKAPRAIATLVTLALSASLAACGNGAAIATVNGQPISRADFDAKLEGNPAARQVLQQSVQEMLLEQYAKDNNIVITDAEVQAKEDAIKVNFAGMPWDQVLKMRGLTEDDVRRAFRDQLILEKAVGKDVTVTDTQVAAYFAKNHAQFDTPEKIQARHILVNDLATANKVEALLKSGKDFAQLAKQYSKDPGSKNVGGELPPFGHGQMVKQFDRAAFSLPVGKISAPVKSQWGYHIIQVEKIQPAVVATLASTHDKIVDLLRQQQEGPLVGPFFQGLLAKANIHVMDPRFDGLFPSPAPSVAPATAAPAATATTAPMAPATPVPAATK
ncbi:MAG TPA: peptidylprolyl isomerase [Candidatus Baltobacteraceae bacterium]